MRKPSSILAAIGISAVALALSSSGCAEKPAALGACDIPSAAGTITLKETQIPAIQITQETLTLWVAGRLEESAILAAELDVYDGIRNKTTNENKWLSTRIHQEGVGVTDISGEWVQLKGPITEISYEIPAEHFLKDPAFQSAMQGGIRLKVGEKFYRREFARIDRETWGSILESLKEQNKKNGRFSFTPHFQLDKRNTDYKFTETLKLPVLVFSTTQEERLSDVKTYFDQIWKDQCGIELEIVDVISWKKDETPLPRSSPVLFSMNELRPEMAAFLLGLEKYQTPNKRALPIVSGLQLNSKDWPNEHIDTSSKYTLQGFTTNFSSCWFEQLGSLFQPLQGKTAIFIQSIENSAILAHEIGHAIGQMHHDTEADHLMNAVVTNNVRITSGLCQKARDRIQAGF